ncbi:hypothetical protein F0562_027413 [Nyssa sinensis]|uniref:Integrase catalytic domain-containing protein n=1 Tax=Nyssa sinensis TaxID=561372 RepID=A0A5J5B8D3_9ASTE|nr:hypothetical protein F0562_027413 [Nyssa sinensis]
MTNGTRSQDIRRIEDAIRDLKESSDKQVEAMAVIKDLVSALNLKPSKSRKRFGDSLFDDVVGQLTKLRQISTVKTYQEKFEELANKTNELLEEFFVSCFVSGLKDEIKAGVQIFRPRNVSQAMGLARLQEETIEALAKKNRVYSKSYNSSLPTNSKSMELAPKPIESATVVKKMTQKEFEERMMKGLYYSCDEKYFRGHVCKKKQLFMIEVSEEEDFFGDVVQEMEKKDVQEKLQILVHALSGSLSYKTMRIKGKVKKNMVIILIDSGSTHNFLDLVMAKRIGALIQFTNPLAVMVAYGTKLQSKAMVKDFQWVMQGTTFTTNMRFLPLGGRDMVLGVQWLSTLGPVLWDFQNVLRSSATVEIQQVEVKAMEKLMQKKPQGIIAQLCSLPFKTAEQEIHSDLDRILQDYADVFKEPKDLPPIRSHDHKIPLKDGISTLGQITKVSSSCWQRITTLMQQKWLSKVMGFDFEITYRSGKSNEVADALSRKGEKDELLLHDQIGSLSALSVVICNWVKDLQTSWHQMLYYKTRLVVENSPKLKATLIKEHHATPIRGHSGGERTYRRIKQGFYWKGVKSYVLKFMAECDICQRNKYETLETPGLLQPLPIPTKLWSDISMDFIEGLPSSSHKTMIYVVVDRLSKYGHFIPLTHPYTATVVAQAFLDNVFKLHGMPFSIVSDWAPVFTGNFWKELFRLQGTSMCMGSTYHPQTDGQTEVVNRCIEGYLKCLTGDRPTVWTKWLPLAEWWYNTTYHVTTEVTPYEALYGQPPHSLKHYVPGDTPVAAADTMLRDRDAILKLLKEHLVQSQQRMKQQTAKHRS